MKLLIGLALLLFFASCFTGRKNRKTGESALIILSDEQKQTAIYLLAAKGCSVCHDVSKKIIGPAFLDISKRYPYNESTLNKLMHKVRTGGKGNWGKIPMVSNLQVDNDDELRLMLLYILSSKNNQP